MGVLDTLLAFIIVIGLLFIIYSGIRKQSIIETINEIKEIFEGKGK